jgi:hypothetical protein
MHQLFTSKGTQLEGDGKVLRVTSGEPFAEVDEVSEAMKLAKLWLFEHPDDTVYLAEDRHVQEVLRNPALERVGHWQGKYYQSSVVYISHIVFLVTHIVAQSLHDCGWLGLALLAGVVVLYHLLWRLKIQNEIESAVAAEIMYVLALVAVPVWHAVLMRRAHG